MIELIPYQKSKILMAHYEENTFIGLPFSGGYRPVLMFFMSKTKDRKYWSSSVMISKRKTPKLCESLIDVAKGDKSEAVFWGQVKKPKTGPWMRMALYIGWDENNIHIQIDRTTGRSLKKKGAPRLRYGMLFSSRETIKLAESIKQLLVDFKPIKLPRRFNYLAKDQLEQQLLKIKRKSAHRERSKRL